MVATTSPSAIHTQLTDALEGVTTELSTSPTMTGRFLMLRSTENTSVLLRTSPEAEQMATPLKESMPLTLS